MPLPMKLYNEASARTDLTDILFFSHIGIAMLGLSLFYQVPMLYFSFTVGSCMPQKLAISLVCWLCMNFFESSHKRINRISYHLHLNACVDRSNVTKNAHRARSES